MIRIALFETFKNHNPVLPFLVFFFIFGKSLFFFAAARIPGFFERFPLLFQGFQGFGRDKEILVFLVVFLAVFPKGNSPKGPKIGEIQDLEIFKRD